MISIALIDDHVMVRDGIRDFFADQPDLRVVAEASSGREAVDIVRKGGVDVIILDISMPEHDGMEALKAIKTRAPDLPVLILSALPEETHAKAVLRWGASGYVNKTCEPAELVTAVRTVAKGRKYISPAVAELLADGLDTAEVLPEHDKLTQREHQIFMRLAKGETTAVIADGMALSPQTISAYVLRVKTKLNLRTAGEITYYALKRGLIQ